MVLLKQLDNSPCHKAWPRRAASMHRISEQYMRGQMLSACHFMLTWCTREPRAHNMQQSAHNVGADELRRQLPIVDSGMLHTQHSSARLTPSTKKTQRDAQGCATGERIRTKVCPVYPPIQALLLKRAAAAGINAAPKVYTLLPLSHACGVTSSYRQRR